MTAEGFHALDEELRRLKTRERPAITAAIGEARQHGDLSENAEYHAAKEDQAHLETRILRLRTRLRNAVVTDAVETGNTMGFARSAEIRDLETDELHQWTIVGAAESDRAAGKLSAESPVAKALLNQAVGTTVQLNPPRGIRRLRIERLL